MQFQSVPSDESGSSSLIPFVKELIEAFVEELLHESVRRGSGLRRLLSDHSTCPFTTTTI